MVQIPSGVQVFFHVSSCVNSMYLLFHLKYLDDDSVHSQNYF